MFCSLARMLAALPTFEPPLLNDAAPLHCLIHQDI
jgi:hypothetical protein